MPKIGFKHVFGDIDVTALGHHVGNVAHVIAFTGAGRAALVASAVASASAAVLKAHAARA